jgi:chemotaxis signal transduction protein
MAPAEPAEERRLVFSLASGSYGLRLEAIAGVAEPSALRPVPGAPPGVLGLTEWGGRPVTVLDLPRLIREGPGKGDPSLVRLAVPFDHLALYVPARLRVEEAPLGTLLEPTELVEAVARGGRDRVPTP